MALDILNVVLAEVMDETDREEFIWRATRAYPQIELELGREEADAWLRRQIVGYLKLANDP